MQRNGWETPCFICSEPVYEIPSRRKIGRGKYCSKKCMAEGFSKEIGSLNRNWKGKNHQFFCRRGGSRYGGGDSTIWERDRDGKFKPRYRIIAEKVLGRKLKKTEHVHHIDMNPLNDSKSNLLICDNQYHKFLENRYAKRFAELYL